MPRGYAGNDALLTVRNACLFWEVRIEVCSALNIRFTKRFVFSILGRKLVMPFLENVGNSGRWGLIGGVVSGDVL